MFHYKFTNTAIDRTETTVREYYDGTKERSCRFYVDKLMNYEYSFGIFTSMLSLIGVRRRQETIVKLIIKGGLKISNEVFHKGRQRVIYPVINKVLNRVRVGSTSADDEESLSHDDVEEEVHSEVAEKESLLSGLPISSAYRF
ncbi:hypothetical protein ACFX1X_021316 [Malus domestica]